MIKRKFIMSTVLIAALTAPTLVYAEANIPVEGKKLSTSIEEKYDDKDSKSKEKEEKCHGFHRRFRNRVSNFNKLLNKAEGITNENKAAIEAAVEKQQALYNEIFKITHANVDDQEECNKVIKEKIKAIKDKVKSGTITEDEAKKQIMDLRRENSSYWNKLSEQGKNEIKAVEAELDKSREAKRKVMDSFKKAIEDKNVEAINNNGRKVADALNSQNNLLQKEIDILNKYLK